MSFLEIFAFSLSCISTYGLAESYYNFSWILSLIASVLGLCLYVQKQCWGHVWLNIYYIIGFVVLMTKSSQNFEPKFIVSFRVRIFLVSALSLMTIFFLSYHPAQADLMAFLTAIVAMELMKRGYIEHWGLWIVHNLSSIIVNYHALLPLMLLKKFLYLLIAFRGWMQWSKLRATIE